MNWQQLKSKSHEDIFAWAETQGWCQAMGRCSQDAQWHAEGDVWTHTKMVCQQLTRLDEWAEMTGPQKTVLTFAALFHDAAKPLTTRTDPDTGKISSPKHAVRGEHLARQVLRDIGCDFETREQIVKLVRYHGRPVFLAERTHPTHEVIRLSHWVNNQLLYLFALADSRGRDTDSGDRPEENLHYWQLTAEENGCLESPFPFANEHARFLFFRKQDPDLNYIPHETFSCEVTMMSGLPGSGKDSWLRKNKAELPIVSLDELRRNMDVDPMGNQGAVLQTARERCRQHLRSGQPFAFNATNLLQQTRRRWIDLFNDYGARIHIAYVEPPLATILSQNKNRTARIPEQVILKLASKYEPPTLTECHELTVHAE